MRHFRGLLFLGAGEHSIHGAKRLHALLDEAIQHSGALQHPGPRYPHDDGNRNELLEMVQDIAAALTGQKITFGDKLDYPCPQCGCLKCTTEVEPLVVYKERVQKEYWESRGRRND